MDSKVKFVVRYVGRDPRGGKDITQDEANAIKAAGLARVIVYQPERSFIPAGTNNGLAAASIAQQDAMAAGKPAERPIYFAVDSDTSQWTAAQWAPTESFFSGVKSVLGVERIGVYGGKHTVEHLTARGFASWQWQTYAWSGGQWADVHIRQYDNGNDLCGGQVDFDRAMKADYGQW